MSLSSMELWALAGSLSVVNSAILITGNDPSNGYYDRHPDIDDWVQDTSHEGFQAALEALKDAILTNELSAAVAFHLTDTSGSFSDGRKLASMLGQGSKLFELRGLGYYPKNNLVFLQQEPAWEKTMIAVRDLKAWLKSKGVYPDFFFPKGDPESFMNKEHPRYSSKLACAISAWRAIEQPAKNKTPKQTVEAWVAANGVNFGLENQDGVVPGAAIEEIAKVVNWQPQGGVARTGGVIDDPLEGDEPSKPDNYEEVEILRDKSRMSLDDVPF